MICSNPARSGFPSTPDVVSGRDWGEACRRICTYVVLQDKETGEIYGHFNTHLDHVALDTQANGVRIILNRIDTVSEKYPDMALRRDRRFQTARGQTRRIRIMIRLFIII